MCFSVLIWHLNHQTHWYRQYMPRRLDEDWKSLRLDFQLYLNSADLIWSFLFHLLISHHLKTWGSVWPNLPKAIVKNFLKLSHIDLVINCIQISFSKYCLNELHLQSLERINLYSITQFSNFLLTLDRNQI